jgi:hypothetical protein
MGQKYMPTRLGIHPIHLSFSHMDSVAVLKYSTTFSPNQSFQKGITWLVSVDSVEKEKECDD